MSFRMRGQAYCAARYAATWVLIVSMSSSAVVFGAPTRRAARKAKKSCCPQPATCSACDECGAGHSTEVYSPGMAPSAGPTPAAPLKSPPDPVPPAPKAENQINIEPANPPMPAPPIPDAGPAAPAPEPKAAEVRPRTSKFHEAAVSQEERPIIVREEAPPSPDFPTSPTAVEPTSTNEKDENEKLVDPEVAPLAVESPKPAEGGSKYQEYLNRYFDRKNTATEPAKTEEPSLPQDEPPTLSPPKPANEYNDPFRPTSYRSSPERTWRDSSGAGKMKARFLGVDDRGMARMVREDGRVSRVPLSSMSKDDLRYIELLAIRDTITSPPQVIAAKPRGR